MRVSLSTLELHDRSNLSVTEEEGEPVRRRSGGEGAGSGGCGTWPKAEPPPAPGHGRGGRAALGNPPGPGEPWGPGPGPREPPEGSQPRSGVRGRARESGRGCAGDAPFSVPPVSRPPPRDGGDSSGGGAAAAERSAGRGRPRLARAPRPPLPGAAEGARRLSRRAGGGGCGRVPPRRAREGRGELGRGRGAAAGQRRRLSRAVDRGRGAAREGWPGTDRSSPVVESGFLPPDGCPRDGR
ncbi:translation initiation factor IF-2-like [Pyrgilauda ruficollis]|uniref:translation initiation factor IF-2-like n=1 Tax=Pyrgilauda ruficollis TaxID=221976 RepID=UPI001B8732F4|nr:translation initiation factor IF-2-like [Pyrgilauda ruficollis]